MATVANHPNDAIVNTHAAYAVPLRHGHHLAWAAALEAVCGVAALALGVLGLFRVAPFMTAAWGVVLAGLGMAVGGAWVGIDRMHTGFEREAVDDAHSDVWLGGGLVLECLGGACAVAFGLTALHAVASWTMLGFAMLALGFALSPTALSVVPAWRNPNEDVLEGSARAFTLALAGIIALAGFGVIALAAIVLFGAHHAALVHFAVIASALSLVFAGGALRMVRRADAAGGPSSRRA